MLTTYLLVSLLLLAIAVLIIIFLRLRRRISDHVRLSQEHENLKERVRDIVDIDAERQRVYQEIEVTKERELRELNEKKQQTLREIDATKERESREIEERKQRELGGLEAERKRLESDIASLRTTREQAVLRLQEQQRVGEAELEAIHARAREAEERVLREYEEQKSRATAELETLQSYIERLKAELKPLDEEAHLQSFGFYKPHYNFASSERYQSKLEDIREQQKWMIKNKSAAICRIQWTVDGSRAAGLKQTNQTLRLLLRAFNGESDAAIAKVKYNNVYVMEARIRKAWEVINSLVGVQQCEIVPAYLDLKLKELYLAHEYQEKIQEEKEEQRRIREQMRDEEIALRELSRAQMEAEREEERYAAALIKARADVEVAVGQRQQKLQLKIEELERRLEEAQANKARAIARAQMTRSGHVYIISNIGSFGEQVFKIGMTRRLDPMDRVRELGDASVPFHFDVHAIIYSEDAPGLEAALHRLFNDRRINRVNERKEFFRVSIDEIAEAVRRHHGEIKIVREAEAVDYRKTLAIIQDVQSSTDNNVEGSVKVSTASAA
jgi:Domain of unknown function (DUF4041)/Meiotically up-regulated gene 113